MAQKINRKARVSGAKRIVVKVGTSNLTGADYALDMKKVENVVRQLVAMRKKGKDVILVTSGAIGAAMGKLKIKRKPRDVRVKQALAAIGQNILMNAYEKAFSKYDQGVAQVLLTNEDFCDRKRYLNARNTLLTLLKMKVIPIVNENDTVGVDEIKIGDNDNLSAMVAVSLEADLLLMLSDIDGLYTRNPKKSRKAEMIKIVEKITPEMEKLAGKSSKGVGGIKTKIEAAKKVTCSGIHMVIANGRDSKAIEKVVSGKDVGTIFLPVRKFTDREHWIAFTSRSRGKLKVDAGAKKALMKKSSLLPSGITGVSGNFNAGDTITVVDSRNREFAKGITNYSSSDVAKIRGRKSSEIEKILGYKGHEEVIYRGNLVLT